MSEIYVIKALWVDALENQRAEAMGYREVGFVESEEQARAIVDGAGLLRGNGWPIPSGEYAPKMQFVKVAKLALGV